MNQNIMPDGDRIYDLYTGVYKPQIIRTALELDIFTPLKAGPANAGAIAQACRCEATGIYHLLNYLTSLNVLKLDGDKYSLSPEAATFLVRGEKAYTGNLIMDFISPSPWECLCESIRTGQPRKIDLEIHFTQDAWIESYRAVRVPSSLEMWAKAGITVDSSQSLRILDLACGCAIKSLVLAKESSHVELTCLDTSQVLEVARDLALRWGVFSQVRFRADNLLTANLDEARYDACLLGQITHYLTEQQNRELYRRISHALIPGGILVLDVPMGSTQLDESSSFLSLLLWANSGGRAYQFEEYRNWLMEGGFASVSQHSERLLSATR
jgi:SAM-dependent methyltransferase